MLFKGEGGVGSGVRRTTKDILRILEVHAAWSVTYLMTIRYENLTVLLVKFPAQNNVVFT